MYNAQKSKIMIALDQTIDCPNCRGSIKINVYELINGGKFTCSTCLSVIAIASENTGQVKERMDKFQELKDSRKNR